MKDQKVDPFVPTQEVWLIDSDPVETNKIKSGISPKVINLSSFDDLVSVINNRLNSSSKSFGTVIFTQNFPTEIKVYLDAIVSALNNDMINQRLFIYHITDKNSSPFLNVKQCKTVDEFIDLANDVHIESIEEDDAVDEEARKIIKKYKQALSKKDNELSSKKEEISDLSDKIKDLSQELSNIKHQIKKSEVENQRYEQERKSAVSERDVLQNKLDVIGKKLDETRSSLDEEQTKNIDNQSKIKGLQRTIEEVNAKNNELFQQNNDLQEEIDHERERSQSYFESKTDSEQLSKLQDDFTSTLELYRKEKEKTSDLRAKLTLKDNEIASRKQEIDQLRNSNKNISNFGIPDLEVYPSIKLKRTDVIYFKVIDQLPYHRFYIDLFAEEMKKIINTNVQVVNMMMKIDAGKDQQRFDDRIFIGNLDAVTQGDDQYYLVPTMNMDKKTYDFEDQDRILIFIDYFDNSKHYVETDGIMDNYIIINRSRDARKIYDLNGKFISNDHSSLVDIKYDSTVSTNTKENQKRRFQDVVKKLLLQSNVIQKYI